MKTINGKKINEKLRVYVNGKRKTAGGGSAPPSLYQEWAGYADSPDLTANYPYQAIVHASVSTVVATYLVCDDVYGLKIRRTGGTDDTIQATDGVSYDSPKIYKLVDLAWVYDSESGKAITDAPPFDVYENNHDIYYGVGHPNYPDLFQAKTTP
jgi:hypothetical protein